MANKQKTPAAATIVEQLAAATPAAPAAKPAKVVSTVQYEVSTKGRDWMPKKTGPVNLKDAATWATLRDFIYGQPSNSATMAELALQVPEHRSYIGYAVRRGWLVPVAA